tara:strand:+ start:372 stop:494 length:123 start_codon:yes stop_codon:yes gene_type:complete
MNSTEFAIEMVEVLTDEGERAFYYHGNTAVEVKKMRSPFT